MNILLLYLLYLIPILKITLLIIIIFCSSSILPVLFAYTDTLEKKFLKIFKYLLLVICISYTIFIILPNKNTLYEMTNIIKQDNKCLK